MGTTTCGYCEKDFPSEDCPNGICAECASWDRCLGTMKRLSDRLSAAREEIGRLREALKPFGDAWRFYSTNWSSQAACEISNDQGTSCPSIKASWLKRAAELTQPAAMVVEAKDGL